MKTSLIIIVLVLLACLVLIGSHREEPVAGSLAETSPGPSFEVRVAFPRLNRPLFGILPESFVARRGGIPREVRFDHASRGAEIGSVEADRLELRADGWDLSIETDGEGRVAPRGGELDGSFRFELATCENAESGKAVAFPAAPLTVSGSFEWLPHDAG